MSRRQWGWILAIGLSLMFLLAAGKYAYDENAISVRSPGLVSAGAFALTVVVGLGNLLGLLGTIQDSSKALAIRIINSLAGRLTIIALSLALGAVFLIAALRVEPQRTWSCAIQRTTVTAPDRARCPEGSFAQMRSIALRLLRNADLTEQPTLRAQVKDRSASAISIDSDRGGLCVATGPDQPTRGESRLVMSTDCGADRLYVVNLHLCDSKALGATGRVADELRAAVRLEIREGNNAYVVVCE